MTTTITPDASATILTGPATDDQIGHLKGLLDPRLRRLSNPNAQVLIRNGGQFQEMFDQGIEQLLGKLVVAAAIDDGKFDYKYVDLPIDQFPLTEEPLDGVTEMHPNAYITTREVMKRVDGASKRFASPLTALRWAAKNPSIQLDHPVAVIFEINGKLWYLLLDGGGSSRDLGVDRYSLDDVWDVLCRFLVVDK